MWPLCTWAWQRLVSVVESKAFLSTGLYFAVTARKTGEFPPNVGDALPDVVKQLLNLGPKLGHSEDVEEGRDSTGEEEEGVHRDIVWNLDRELQV